MNLLDSHSRLNRFKVKNGIRIYEKKPMSAYLMQRTIEKYFMQRFTNSSLEEEHRIKDNPIILDCLNNLNKMDKRQITEVFNKMDKEADFNDLTDYILKRGIYI